MIVRHLAASVVVTALAAPSFACAFHGYAPKPTLVDRLLGSEHVVLARQDLESPFRYAAVEALEGSVDSVEIPLLVDTATRNRFARDDDATVLFARDGAYGPWTRLAFVDQDLQPILDDIIDRLPVWELGDDADRFGYFAPLINHTNPTIRTLALNEIDLANYEILRSLPLEIDTGAIAERLNLPNELNLKPIRVLLLGLSKDPDAVPLLKAGLKSSAFGNGPFLGAYATALIESEGTTGIDWIADTFLKDPYLSADSREKLIEAIAIQNTTADPEIQIALTAALEDALIEDTSLAPFVARQFGIRADWTHSERLTDILRTRDLTSPADIIVVAQYVALAAEAE